MERKKKQKNGTELTEMDHVFVCSQIGGRGKGRWTALANVGLGTGMRPQVPCAITLCPEILAAFLGGADKLFDSGVDELVGPQTAIRGEIGAADAAGEDALQWYNRWTEFERWLIDWLHKSQEGEWSTDWLIDGLIACLLACLHVCNTLDAPNWQNYCCKL